MLKLCGLGLLAAVAAIPCLGQASQSSSPQPSASQGSSGSSTANGGEAKPVTQDDKKKTKKVWTNDDLSSVKGTVSVVGDAKNSTAEGASKKSDSASGGGDSTEAKDARKQLVESYRARIADLQSQIVAADQKINELRNFKGENATPAGGINPNKGYNMVPLEDQIKQQEDKKKQCLAKIDDIEIEAGKNGIEPGELR
jgi:hypothetical protein